LVALRCVAPTDVLRSRLRSRREPATWSDADEQVGLRVAAEFDPWPTAFAVDTSRTPDTALEQASTVLGLESMADWPRLSRLAPD
jgi:predicted kinase